LLLGFLQQHALLSAPVAKRAASRNLLIITIDTLRADRLSCYGSKFLNTPNIDILARRGALFSRAFAHNPTTLPSHANILLGLTPLTHGVHENSGFIVGKEFLTLAEYLKSYKYSTAAFVGAFPLDSRFGLDQGFDIYDDEYEAQSSQKFSYGERKASVVIDRALAWLETQASRWFLWIHVFDPHHPYEPPEPFKAQFRNQPYDGEVAYVDAELGRLIGFLEKNNLFEDTLIVLTSDHGESLGQHGEKTHGFLAYNTTLWVPLVIIIPGEKQTRVDGYVCHTDIFPTICEALGLKTPEAVTGISLIPAMKGRRLPERKIYFESLYPYYQRGWAPIRGVIEKRKKFIDSPLPELYDLENDFDERENLAGRTRIDNYRKKLEAVLAEGRLSANRQPVDKSTLEKLTSLGYISGPIGDLKKNFEARDDVKILLPFYNKTTEAMDLHYSGESSQAINLIKEVITERPDVDIAYSKLATVYKEIGRPVDALEVLRLGIKTIPSSFEILASYVNHLMDARLYQEAIQAINSSKLRQMDYDPEIWNYLGLAYMRTGDDTKAEASFKKAMAIDPEYAVVYTNFGTLYLTQYLRDEDRGSYEKCVFNFKKAIELDPEYAMAYNGLGAAYKQAGLVEDAIFSWEKALELKPGFNLPLYNLGMAYFGKGNKAKALVYLTQYLDKYSDQIPPEEKRRITELIAQCKQKSPEHSLFE
jgi:arylsulfatase A-like enzyme/Flp pilus assembly protein TadD